MRRTADVRLVNRRAKTQKAARWNSDQSESEEEAPSDEESVPDPSEKGTSPRRSSSVVSETGQESNKEEDGGEPSEREKKFGRKARVKAQVSRVRGLRGDTALMGS
jgi:sister-chromatid-cohesion protein PDS5